MAVLPSKLERLSRALSCPQQATTGRYPISIQILLYECWASLLCVHLSEHSLVDLLTDDEGRTHQNLFIARDDCVDDAEYAQFGGQPHQPWRVESLLAGEVDTIVHTLEGSRTDLISIAGFSEVMIVQERVGDEKDRIQQPQRPRPTCGIWLDEEFNRLTKSLWQLGVVPREMRTKHWPPLHITTWAQLLKHSRIAANVGWLDLGTDPETVRRYALAVLALHFACELSKRSDSIFLSDRAEAFLQLWTDLFEQGTFRLGLTHNGVIGAQDGQPCTNMVYDFDLANMQFHCFPVRAFPTGTADYIENQIEF